MCVLVTDMCESEPESMTKQTSRILVQKERGKERSTLQKQERGTFVHMASQ